MDISGNTILITGGGTGIGRALAEALHTKGNQIIIAGRKRPVLEEVVAANPGMAMVQLDVADADAIQRVSGKLIAEHPALNVVIQNAGIMIAEDVTADPYDLTNAENMIATNLLGPIRLAAALLPHLMEQSRATMMTVSSGLAFVPLAMTPTYSATKAAIHSWSQSLRHQLQGTHVEIIELAPPGVATKLMPGHDTNPHSMPLQDYIDEVIALIEANPDAPEILVERVKPLRDAERSGHYDQVFGMVNQPR